MKELNVSCSSQCFYDGKVVEAGEKFTLPEDEAHRLLASGRFELADEDNETTAKAPPRKK